MSINCQYYHEGMCLYLNRRFAVFEKCWPSTMSNEYREKFTENCSLKDIIKKLDRIEKKSELEEVEA